MKCPVLLALHGDSFDSSRRKRNARKLLRERKFEGTSRVSFVHDHSSCVYQVAGVQERGFYEVMAAQSLAEAEAE